MSTKYCVHGFRLPLHLFILLALSACGNITVPTATPMASRLPDQNMVKNLLVRVVDEEKLVPVIVIGMIADDPQERWVIGYGRLSANDERVPDGDTVFQIDSITKVFPGILLAQAVLTGEHPKRRWFRERAMENKEHSDEHRTKENSHQRSNIGCDFLDGVGVGDLDLQNR